MAATSYGLSAGGYEAMPDFVASRDDKGAWNASNSFSMLRDTWENTARGTFLKGTSITLLFVELPNYWSFLELETAEVAHQPGGWVRVFCTYTGWTESEFDEDEDVTFILSGTRVERSILEHPLLIKEMQDYTPVAKARQARTVLVGGWANRWEVDPVQSSTSEIFYVRVADRADDYTETNADAVKWGLVIHEQGIRTYKAPTLQWTIETSSLNGWQDADVEKLGLVEYDKIARPPGFPPVPKFGNHEWIKISMNQTLTRGRAVQSQTWELSGPNGTHRFIDPVTEQPEPVFGGAGIYNYSLSDLE